MPGRLHEEVLGARVHRRDHIVDAAMGGLHDHRNIEAGIADLGQHAQAVEAGHHEVEHDGIDGLGFRRGQKRDGRVAAVDHGRCIAGFLHHVLDETALDWVIVDNQNGRRHGFPYPLQLFVSNRGTFADAD